MSPKTKQPHPLKLDQKTSNNSKKAQKVISRDTQNNAEHLEKGQEGGGTSPADPSGEVLKSPRTSFQPILLSGWYCMSAVETSHFQTYLEE